MDVEISKISSAVNLYHSTMSSIPFLSTDGFRCDAACRFPTELGERRGAAAKSMALRRMIILRSLFVKDRVG